MISIDKAFPPHCAPPPVRVRVRVRVLALVLVLVLVLALALVLVLVLVLVLLSLLRASPWGLRQVEWHNTWHLEDTCRRLRVATRLSRVSEVEMTTRRPPTVTSVTVTCTPTTSVSLPALAVTLGRAMTTAAPTDQTAVLTVVMVFPMEMRTCPAWRMTTNSTLATTTTMMMAATMTQTWGVKRLRRLRCCRGLLVLVVPHPAIRFVPYTIPFPHVSTLSHGSTRASLGPRCSVIHQEVLREVGVGVHAHVRRDDHRSFRDFHRVKLGHVNQRSGGRCESDNTKHASTPTTDDGQHVVRRAWHLPWAKPPPDPMAAHGGSDTT